MYYDNVLRIVSNLTLVHRKELPALQRNIYRLMLVV